MKIKILKPSKAELLRQYQQLYDESTIVEVEFNSLKQEVLNRQVFIMADDEEYCLRLEKIIDKQDGLLNHYDAKFNQQNSLNDALSRQNKILKEDLQKHKNLLKDMKKNIDQHKNVVNKLKKELESLAPLEYYLTARGRGGIGRRVGFRCLWASAREGSSPFARTIKCLRLPAMGAFFVRAP